MHRTLEGVDADRLERSCDDIRLGAGPPGIEHAAVRLSGPGFSPHRHDTYAVGVTLAGVQVFRYRGSRRVCLPGQVHVLHPDELHDGGPGTDEGFAYRILYIDPGLVGQALGTGTLPFVMEPVHHDPSAVAAVRDVLARLEDPTCEVAAAEVAATVADVLVRLAGGQTRDSGPVDHVAMARVREYLGDHAPDQTSAATLELIAGLDRYAIARQFRRAYGTSPDRYRTMRRLELARVAIAGGAPLARAATDCGFADQSHMTRQFVRAYGMTPGRWARSTAA
jgi:AraC-like DNA-binding protein